MAPKSKSLDNHKISLCAELSDIAYVSSKTSLTNAKHAFSSRLVKFGLQPQITAFHRFYSRPWVPWDISEADRQKKFGSFAYLCHFKTPENVDRIVVGFRGTSGDADDDQQVNEGAQARTYTSRLANKLMKIIAPSNLGFSDFLYDATIIRVPYRRGAVFSWYQYFGSLMLQKTSQSPSAYPWPRKVAMDWMSKGSHSKEEMASLGGYGNVHLGFWSLWASPEGFARYDKRGKLADDNSVLAKVTEALEKTENNDTEVFVVGHSLGGAVSSFAALEIAEKLKSYPNATMYHVTFGAPPVGTKAFAQYFDRTIRPRHHSLSIIHAQDIVPHCFSWCASTRPMRYLDWWGNWSHVGKQHKITRTLDPGVFAATDGTSLVDKGKWIFIFCLTLMWMLSAGVSAVPAGGLAYLRSRDYYAGKQNPAEDFNKSQREAPRKLLEPVDLDYHSLKRYIELLKDENVVQVSDG